MPILLGLFSVHRSRICKFVGCLAVQCYELMCYRLAFIQYAVDSIQSCCVMMLLHPDSVQWTSFVCGTGGRATLGCSSQQHGNQVIQADTGEEPR